MLVQCSANSTGPQFWPGRALLQDNFHGRPNLACALRSAVVYSRMFGVTTSDDYRPVAWMGRYPVDVTTMLVGTHVFCAVVVCVLTAIPGLASTLDYFYFDSARIWNGMQLWRLATYAFVHAPSGLLW